MAELVKTRRRCYTKGDEIKLLSEIEELDKPEFVEISDKDLMDMFRGMIVVKEDEEPEPMEFPSTLKYGIYGEDWYAAKFPGFPDETYTILAEVDKEANKE
jgi:hypothetical protein